MRTVFGLPQWTTPAFSCTMAMVRTDDEILDDILSELRWDGRVAPTEIAIQVRQGVVHLTGVVTRASKRTVMEAIAIQVDGVQRVQNDIEVREARDASKPHRPVHARRNSFTWEVPKKSNDQ